METIQHEVDQSSQCSATTQDHPVLEGLVADQTSAYTQEVRLLRQRVAMLETALEATKATVQVTDTPPVSEFSAPTTPAVVAVASKPVASEPGFAQAWDSEDEVSFEERVAEKAFFEATTVDQQSRSWLLQD